MEDKALKKGIGYLNKRIQSSSLIVMVLAAGIVVPITVEHSNKKQQAMHLPTVLCSYFTFLSGLSLRGLVAECLNPTPGRLRYTAIKALVHACALLLVSLSFSLSLMMRMNPVATSATLAAAAAFVAYRLWRCARTTLEDDVKAYRGCEEELQQLLELSTNVTSMLFGGWFGMAFFYFQNYPEEARDARFLPSEYLTFFTSVAGSLMLLNAVRKIAGGSPDVREIVWLTRALVASVVLTALVIAASKVRGYTVLALFPEAIALLVWCWCVWQERRNHALPGPGPLPGQDNGGAAQGEPASHSFVSVSLTLLLSVLTYRAKDVQALSTLYDEAFVLVTAAAVVAALGWRLLTPVLMVPVPPEDQPPVPTEDQPPVPTEDKGVKAAAKTLAFFTFLLLTLSVLAFLGVMFGM